MLREDSPHVKLLIALLLDFTKEDYIALEKASRYMAMYPGLLEDRAVLQRVLKAAGLIEEVTE